MIVIDGLRVTLVFVLKLSTGSLSAIDVELYCFIESGSKLGTTPSYAQVLKLKK